VMDVGKRSHVPPCLLLLALLCTLFPAPAHIHALFIVFLCAFYTFLLHKESVLHVKKEIFYARFTTCY
jgi:hypothetical protein